MDLRKLTEFENKNPKNNKYLGIGWESYELGLRPCDIKNLLNDGLVHIVYRSNKHTGYLLNREEVERQLRMQ